MRKPTILICTDSPMIDTGFARVGREIATGLQLTGKYNVAYHAWFHRPHDKLVPFRIFPTDMTNTRTAEADKYGQYSFDTVVEKVKPDLVLTIGDEWMIRHFAQRVRDYPLVSYVPIDGAPLMQRWLDTFNAMDRLVLYGAFGEHVVRTAGFNGLATKIPHGVDTNTFRPLSPSDKDRSRQMVSPDPRKFIIGCVARNNTRKQIPRLLKAYREFLNPWTACQHCGAMVTHTASACVDCHSVGDLLVHGKGKEDVFLYLHMDVNDSAGHPIIPLIERFKLNGYVGVPENMTVGKGVPDEQLNCFYNAFDLFTLPTSGEGWGLPILEAMSAGCPVLVTDYSAHQEFVNGAGEFINVGDWDTCQANNMERALVDIQDYVLKLDRFYYEPAEFVRKWGAFMQHNGHTAEQVNGLDTGKRLIKGLSSIGRERATQYEWGPIIERWDSLLEEMLSAKAFEEAPVARLSTETI